MNLALMSQWKGGCHMKITCHAVPGRVSKTPAASHPL